MTGGDGMNKGKDYEFPIREWKRVLLGVVVGTLTILAATGGFAWLASREIMDRQHFDLASA